MLREPPSLLLLDGVPTCGVTSCPMNVTSPPLLLSLGGGQSALACCEAAISWLSASEADAAAMLTTQRAHPSNNRLTLMASQPLDPQAELLILAETAAGCQCFSLVAGSSGQVGTGARLLCDARINGSASGLYQGQPG